MTINSTSQQLALLFTGVACLMVLAAIAGYLTHRAEYSDSCILRNGNIEIEVR